MSVKSMAVKDLDDEIKSPEVNDEVDVSHDLDAEENSERR